MGMDEEEDLLLNISATLADAHVPSKKELRSQRWAAKRSLKVFKKNSMQFWSRVLIHFILQKQHIASPASPSTQFHLAKGGEVQPPSELKGYSLENNVDEVQTIHDEPKPRYISKRESGEWEPVEQPRQVGRLRLASRNAGYREPTPDLDDIKDGSSKEADDVMDAVNAVLARELLVQRELEVAGITQPEYHDVLDGNGIVDFTSGRDYHLMNVQKKRKTKHEREAGPTASLIKPKPGELVHAGTTMDMSAAVFAAESFEDLPLSKSLVHNMHTLNFTKPTYVQQRVIPLLGEGKDVLVNAPTGSGKTLAYVAPIVNELSQTTPKINRSDGTYALIIAPTRELCLQVNDVLSMLVRRCVWVVGGAVHGGENRDKEKAKLRKGISILVATPGRLLDHLENTNAFNISNLTWLVLDEADRLLDLGFEKKVAKIVHLIDERSQCISTRKTALLSATMHAGIGRLAALSLRNPMYIGMDQIDKQNIFDIPKTLRQSYLEVPAKLRLVVLAALLKSKMKKPCKAVIFMSNCDSVEFYHAIFQGGAWEHSAKERLLPIDIPVLKLHGNMVQRDRTETLVTYTKASSGVLLCTDVASRGLDFPEVTLIVQFDPPGEAEDYVHRVGRTARLGRAGEAVLFLTPEEIGYLEHLRSHGVSNIQSQAAYALVDGALSMDRSSAGLPLERHHGAFALQKQLMSTVASDKRLTRMATDAFRSFIRAYATHSGELKGVFHPKRLHLGHVAHSFALNQRPGVVGKSSHKEEAKRKKAEAVKDRKKHARQECSHTGMGGYTLG